MDRTTSEARLDSFFATLASELANKYGRTPEKQSAIDRLAIRCRKRAAFERPELEPLQLAKFCKINAEVQTHVWNLPSDVEANARHFILVALERYTSSVDELSIQNPLCMEHVFDNWRFGPGASNGIQGTHTAEKLSKRMTCTTLCEPLVSSLRLRNAYLAAKDSRDGLGTTVVEGSRMQTVPKNEDTVRTIAIEPSGNMALQLAAGHYLEGTLRYVGLDITTQEPKNKRLARVGSVTGRLATIDLSAASDRISIELVRRLLPSKWFELLVKLRSPITEFPDGTKVELNMISTMGNGFTFPLMTLLICSIIYGMRAVRHGPSLYIDWTHTAVYGDDIIVPTHEYHTLCDLLNGAGFVVNHDKSFSDGPFRESCGGDYWLGVDITPFYVESLSSNAELYVALNKVLEWCARHEIVLHCTILNLLRLLGNRPFLVPEWYNPDQGILTSRCGRRFKYLSIQQGRLELKNHEFAVMLACGGYLTPDGPDMFYIPRGFGKPRYSVRQARLPSGYLDGWSPERGTKTGSAWISMILEILS